jgi:hypothetical protein
MASESSANLAAALGANLLSPSTSAKVSPASAAAAIAGAAAKAPARSGPVRVKVTLQCSRGVQAVLTKAHGKVKLSAWHLQEAIRLAIYNRLAALYETVKYADSADNDAEQFDMYAVLAENKSHKSGDQAGLNKLKRDQDLLSAVQSFPLKLAFAPIRHTEQRQNSDQHAVMPHPMLYPILPSSATITVSSDTGNTVKCTLRDLNPAKILDVFSIDQVDIVEPDAAALPDPAAAAYDDETYGLQADELVQTHRFLRYLCRQLLVRDKRPTRPRTRTMKQSATRCRRRRNRAVQRIHTPTIYGASIPFPRLTRT